MQGGGAVPSPRTPVMAPQRQNMGVTGSRLKQGPWTPPLPGHIHSHTAGRRTHPGGPSDEGTHTLLPTRSPSPGSPPSTAQPPGSTPREGPARPISDLSPPRVGPPAPCLKPRRSQSHSRPQGALWWECWGMSGTLEEHRTGLDPQGQGQGAGTVWGQRPARMNPRDQGGDTLGGAVEGTDTCDLAKVNVALVPTVQMEPGREVSPGPSLASSALPLPPHLCRQAGVTLPSRAALLAQGLPGLHSPLPGPAANTKP